MTDDPFDGLNPLSAPEMPPQHVTDMAEFRNRPRQAHARRVNSSGRKSRFSSRPTLRANLFRRATGWCPSLSRLEPSRC